MQTSSQKPPLEVLLHFGDQIFLESMLSWQSFQVPTQMLIVLRSSLPLPPVTSARLCAHLRDYLSPKPRCLTPSPHTIHIYVLGWIQDKYSLWELPRILPGILLSLVNRSKHFHVFCSCKITITFHFCIFCLFRIPTVSQEFILFKDIFWNDVHQFLHLRLRSHRWRGRGKIERTRGTESLSWGSVF